MRQRLPASGVTVGNPEFEWREVARQYHYTFDDFLSLSIEEQSATIAHHRVRNQIEAVLNKDALDKAKKQSKKK